MKRKDRIKERQKEKAERVDLYIKLIIAVISLIVAIFGLFQA